MTFLINVFKFVRIQKGQFLLSFLHSRGYRTECSY